MSDKIQDDAMLQEENHGSFGDILKSTREQMGLSVQEAASRLHLSPRFITMLETENLQHCNLPSIYLRGYLRSYTRLLNLPEHDLARALEKLEPQPLPLDPLPLAASEALSLTFPLGKYSYYVRIATVLISLAVLTCTTAWWQLHANTAVPTVATLEQPLVTAETLAQSTNEAAPATPPTLNANPLLEAAANPNPAPEQAQVPAAALELAAQKPVALASAATAEANTHTLTPQPAAKKNDGDDEGVDEQE